MNTAILIAQVVAVIIQACFLLISILLLAGVVRSNTTLLDAQTAQIDADLALEEHRAAEAAQTPPVAHDPNDPWQGRWPPWETPGRENTSN